MKFLKIPIHGFNNLIAYNDNVMAHDTLTLPSPCGEGPGVRTLYMKKILLSFILALTPCVLLFAQQLSEGTVMSKADASPLKNAIVTISDKADNTLAYGATNEKGYFRLTFDMAPDSVVLAVHLLGYESQRIPLKSPLHKMDIHLEQKAIQLKEVKINPEYVRVKEDTISYNVSALLTQNDRSIGDVLRKIPGLQVSKSGGITYEGDPINVFYIEGMNLLEKKYGIATNNVPADAISTVEVIEHHQPVKMLKGEVFSPYAAINLKLKAKKKSRPVGDIEVGGGYGFDDLLWLMKLFGLQVQDNRQTIAMYKTNNTGENITAELNDQRLSADDLESYRPLPRSLLNETGFSSPPLEESRLLFNQTHAVSLNNLWKTGDDTRFRANFNYWNDAREEQLTQTASYFLDEQAFVINEYKFLERNVNTLNGALTYTDNSSEQYLDNALKTHWQWADTRSDIQNQQPVIQSFDLSDFYIQNSLKYGKKIKGRVWNFRSFVRYLTSPQQLSVSSDPAGGENRQAIERDGFYTHNDTYFIYRKGISSWRITAELEAAFDNLNTDLNRILLDSLQNKLHSDYVKLTLTPKYSCSYGKFSFSASLPFVLHWLYVDDRQYDRDRQYDYLYLNPSASVGYTINALAKINLSGSYTHNTGDITDFMTAYLMPDYTHLRLGSGLLSRNQSLRYAVSYYYRDALNGLYYNFIGYYLQNKKNLMGQQRFDERMIVSGNMALANKMETFSGMADIAKNFYYQGITLSLNIQYLNAKSEQLQQRVLYPLRSEVLSATPKISAIIKKYATVSYEARLSNSRLTIQSPVRGETKTAFNQLSQILKGYYFPSKILEVKVQAEYLYNEVSAATHTHSVFADLGITYKYNQFDFTLHWHNIMNQKEYAYTQYDGLDTYSYSYRLRPQSLMASVKFKY
ncbi:MAG: carboxypeptidase-like regulatory domain-containing protein [Dysgonamonadaceae bacterium]|jgi:hypothetical protein|nr:carboxypeptidase-like regulatory domain-containing protein [Dysgonamonadaceae bacterium]